MYTPIYLKIKNILTHKDNVIKFIKGEATMIVGKNECGKSQKSNGSGKSAILEGVSLAFTGETIRDVNISKIITNGEDVAEVELRLDSNDESILIKRTFHRKKSSTLEIFVNTGKGCQKIDIASIDHGNELICNRCGVNKKDLYDYYIVSKKRYSSFYNSTDGQKKALISRFSKADRILPVFAMINEDISGINEKIVKTNDTISFGKGQLEAYNEQLKGVMPVEDIREKMITDLQKAIDDELVTINDHEEACVQYQNNINIKNDVITEKDIKKKELNKTIGGVSREIEGCRNKILKIEKIIGKIDKKYDSIGEDIIKIEKSVDNEKQILQEFNKLKDEVDLIISGAVTCPNCQHEFSPKEKTVNIIEAKKALEDVITEIDKQNEKIEAIESNISDFVIIRKGLTEDKKKEEINIKSIKKDKELLEKKLTDINTAIREIDADIIIYNKNIVDLNRDISRANENILKCQDVVSKLKAEIIDTEKKKIEDLNESIKTRIEEITIGMGFAEDELTVLSKELSVKKSYISIFNMFMTYLSNKSLKIIESKTNSYLSKMGSDMSVEIDGFTINKDGSVREKIDVNVNRNGIYSGSFMMHSEGEKAEIDISTILANQDLINLSTNGKGLDMLFTDEITESVDSSGIGDVINAISELGKTIAIITHVNDNKVTVKNTIVVKKQSNKISIIE